jgi:geranylgeranyl transferase type-2 subunit beta
MTAEPYLPRLTARLADGVRRLDVDQRERQGPDGGWSGREGGSDLYYTGFALRGLAVLDALTPEVCDRAAGFLRRSLASEASVVDFFSLLYAALLVQASGGADVLAGSPPDWPDRVAAALESYRTADGGYGKVVGAASGSTYHTFLVALCYELLGRTLPDPGRAVEFVLSRRREDGGFVEVAPMKRSGTNPTAAAVGLLRVAAPAALEERPEVRRGVVEFLVEMASDEGGLRANGRVPLADLLSTFTGAWTLAELGAIDRLDGDGVVRYALDCEQPPGGFHGGLWDTGFDVEYTFYGVGTLGLLT